MASLEKVAGFLRNARPLCSGLGGRLRPEWVAGLSGIHSLLDSLTWRRLGQNFNGILVLIKSGFNVHSVTLDCSVDRDRSLQDLFSVKGSSFGWVQKPSDQSKFDAACERGGGVQDVRGFEGEDESVIGNYASPV